MSIPRVGVLAAALMVCLVPVARASTPAPAAAAEGVPHLEHVFVLVLENSNYDATWGAGGPPYLKTLQRMGAFVPDYFGTGHVSADNYIAMTSGQLPTPPFMSDCENWTACYGIERARPDNGRNITDQLLEKGLRWKAYMESMPGTCVHPAATQPVDPYSSPYATRHDPFVYYPTILDAADPHYCDTHVVPYDRFSGDLADDAVGNYTFITPDTCSDGHDGSNPVTPCTKGAGHPGGLTEVNTWLMDNVPPILDYVRSHRGALVITFDENGFTDPNCCDANGAFGGHIGALVLSPFVRPGTVSHLTSDHYGLLRTIEDAFRIGEHLNHAGATTTTPLNDIWTSVPS